MPYYRVGGMMMHVRMDKRARKKAAPPCPFWAYARRSADGMVDTTVRVRCLAPATYLCDWLGCNSPICDKHAQQLVPGFDFCPTHNSVRGLFSRLLPPPEKPQ